MDISIKIYVFILRLQLEKVRPSLDQNMNVINCLFWYQRYCGYLIDGGQKVSHKSIDLCHELEICQSYQLSCSFQSVLYLRQQCIWTEQDHKVFETQFTFDWDCAQCTMSRIQCFLTQIAFFCLILDCFTFVVMTHVININSYYFLFNVML